MQNRIADHVKHTFLMRNVKPQARAGLLTMLQAEQDGKSAVVANQRIGISDARANRFSRLIAGEAGETAGAFERLAIADKLSIGSL